MLRLPSSASRPEDLRLQVDWTVVFFIAVMYLIAVPASIWAYRSGWLPFRWETFYFTGIYFLVSGFAVTAGYHRCLSHRAFDAHPAVNAFFLLFAPASFVGSAKQWGHNHRLHHRYVDGPRDPYAITGGFWWAHFLAIFFTTNDQKRLDGMPDFADNRLIQLQDRYLVAISFVSGIVIPCAIASLWGDMLGGLLMGFCLRVPVQHQFVFSVNSVAHWFGRQTYDKNVSARDNQGLIRITATGTLLAVAGMSASLVWGVPDPTLFRVSAITFFACLGVIALGENPNHSAHHKFPSDYRNGFGFFDPTRWVIELLAMVRGAWNLRTTPPEAIDRARQEALQTQ